MRTFAQSCSDWMKLLCREKGIHWIPEVSFPCESEDAWRTLFSRVVPLTQQARPCRTQSRLLVHHGGRSVSPAGLWRGIGVKTTTKALQSVWIKPRLFLRGTPVLSGSAASRQGHAPTLDSERRRVRQGSVWNPVCVQQQNNKQRVWGWGWMFCCVYAASGKNNHEDRNRFTAHYGWSAVPESHAEKNHLNINVDPSPNVLIKNSFWMNFIHSFVEAQFEMWQRTTGIQ